MNRHVNVDRELESWLAEGPSQLPDHVIDGIVRQLEEIHQRKRWWLPGRREVSRLVFALSGAAAAVVIAFLALGLGFQPGGVGAPPTEPEGELFVSERHGYTLRLPDDGWAVVERAGEWRPGTTFNESGPGVDRVTAPVGLGYRHDVFLNSQPLDPATSFEEWLEVYDRLGRQVFAHCRASDEYETTVDGADARVSTAVCDGDDWAEALWTHGGRVYSLRVGEHPDSGVPIDARQELQSWLERITLHE
jgi:hypothetical protein